MCFPSILKVPLNTPALLLSVCCPVTARRLHPAILLALIRAWRRSKHGHTHLPFPPINNKFTEAAFLPLTELSSQGGYRQAVDVWSEQHTSHMAAYTNSLNWEHTLRNLQRLDSPLAHNFPRDTQNFYSWQ